MEFCEKCRYSFNITRDVKSKQVGGKINIALNNFFEKIADNILTSDDLNGITFNDIEGDERFENLNKKDQERVRKMIKNINKDFFNEDNEKELSNNAFYICKKCKNFKEIPPGKIIYSKNYNSSTTAEIHDYSFDAHDPSLPLTRNYICKNKKCITHKDDSKKEAALTRNNKYQIIYICKACETFWINST